MLVEIIFKGLFSFISIDFLSGWLINAKAVRFDYPEEIYGLNRIEEIREIFKSVEYVDLVITTDNFVIKEKVIPKVFINLTKDKDNIDMLVYFDLHDFNSNEKSGIDDLINWTGAFNEKYNFSSFVCQIDNANEKEYYFNSDGLGPLYDRISR